MRPGSPPSAAWWCASTTTALQFPLHQDAVGDSGGERHPRHSGRRHPQADPLHPRRRQPARAHLTGADTPREEALERCATPAAPRRGSPGQLQKALVFPHRQPPLQRGGGGLRHQAQHRPLAERRGAAMSRWCPGTPPRTRSSPCSRTGCSSPTARATRRMWRRSSSWCAPCAGELPIFGICLGHQLISLAYGARTYKLKFGHRGGNHPVKNLDTGKIEITSQNHSYAVDAESLCRAPA